MVWLGSIFVHSLKIFLQASFINIFCGSVLSLNVLNETLSIKFKNGLTIILKKEIPISADASLGWVFARSGPVNIFFLMFVQLSCSYLIWLLEGWDERIYFLYILIALRLSIDVVLCIMELILFISESFNIFSTSPFEFIVCPRYLVLIFEGMISPEESYIIWSSWFS